jgi:hypothetical protein
MRNAVLVTLAWLALAVHLAVGIAVGRRWSGTSLLAMLNLATAACVLCYWIPRWFDYAFRGITWYATDQLLPLYAILVCVLAALTLAGRIGAIAPQWIVFGIHTIVLLVGAVFFSIFKINRLI